MATTGHLLDQQKKQHQKALKHNCVFNYKIKDKFPTNYADMWVQKNILSDKADTI